MNNKHARFVNGLLLVFALSTPEATSAEEIRYEFSGVVDTVQDRVAPTGIAYGSTFTGSFTYDDSVPGKVATTAGQKEYSDNQTGAIEILVEGQHHFRMELLQNYLSTTNLIVRDGSSTLSDEFSFSYSGYAAVSPTHPALFSRSMAIVLNDNENKDAITSDVLKGITLDLSSFTRARMGVSGNNDGSLHQDFRIGGIITSLTLCSNTAPVADAGPNQMVECTGPDGAFVTLDATASSDPDGDMLSYEWSVPDGVDLIDPTIPTSTGLFPIGITTATLTVTDGNGGLHTDNVVITVVDQTPPEVACTTSLAAIWPPNHDMVPILVCVEATDSCFAPENFVLGLVTIQSNEPDDADGLGDGETTGDVDGEDGYTAPVDVTDFLVFNPETACFEGIVFLRAERDGDGFGRTYSINATVLDTALNLAETSCVVIVPHDRRKQK